MSRAQVCASILGLGLMLTASSTEARELELFLETRLGGDSNVFRRADDPADQNLDPKAAGTWEISPRLTLRDEQDELEYDFRYQPTYERFFAVEDGGNDDDISGFDHLAAGDFVWRVSPVASIGGNGRFSRQRRLREGFQDLSVLPDPPLEQTDNEYVQRSRGTVYFNRAFTPSTSIQGSYTFDDFDISEQQQGDSRLHSVSGGGSYAITQHTRVGANATFRTRATKASFDPDPTNSGTPETDIRESRSQTDTFDISFSIEQALSPHLSVSVAVGPSFFDTRDENSLGDVSFNTDDSVFAAITVTRQLQRGELELSYTRSEGGGGGATAATSILDSLTGTAVYRPTRRWVLRGRLGWTHRATISSDAFLGRDIRTDWLTASVNAQRRVTQNFSIIGTFRYGWSRLDDFQPGVFLSPTVFLASRSTRTTNETIQGTIALRYIFDPYVF